MSSDPIDDQARTPAGPADEEPTAELPRIVAPVEAVPVAAVAVARVALPNALVLGREATVPIGVPANLLGDAPVRRPSGLVLIAVYGAFLFLAILLVVALMVAG